MPDSKKFTSKTPTPPPGEPHHRPPMGPTDLKANGKPVIGPPENGPKLDEPPTP
jgi:hypothetical protein